MANHDLKEWAMALLGLVLLTRLVSFAYNILLHPLRAFPGPLAHRASRLPFAINHARGRGPFCIHALHEHYGPVVRVAPNHLSFTDPRAWRDIYGPRHGPEYMGDPENPKQPVFYESLKGIEPSILNADYSEHARLRRALAPGFSDKAMRAQEPLIGRYVSLLVRRLRQNCEDGKKALNMVAWYNWTTFDIVGDLVFGESFACLEEERYHPFVGLVVKSLEQAGPFTSVGYLGMKWVLDEVVTRALALMGSALEVEALLGGMREKLVKRFADVARGVERNDLFEGVVRKKDEWNLSMGKLETNAALLVGAGSETTASALSGITYLLLRNPDVLEKVQQEVRAGFDSADEITLSSVSRLTYMLAVINEGLRLYPPALGGLVRQTPASGTMIAGRFIPGKTTIECQPYSMNHSSTNWKDPWAFRPERFLSRGSNEKDDGQAADFSEDAIESFQPFNVGPRNCIGINLAYAELRLIMARVIYEFDLSLGEENDDWIEMQHAFSTWLKIPLNVYLKPVVWS
ncbi:isotrichodermin C-15 hydroxylase [Bombardia bombarda]|uniref:Isotrichodermin C-15 hydroxylase n=1 Tax=Bombardia bombarda TaxID=252184 RepID=A0AA39TLQ2_9PEZI|nr:isotrichodermin C-15 hydroxylase [Bombardia bombarda]